MHLILNFSLRTKQNPSSAVFFFVGFFFLIFFFHLKKWIEAGCSAWTLGAWICHFESSVDVSIFLSFFLSFFGMGGVVVVGGGGWGGGGFTVIYVSVFLHESQPRVTAGWVFFFFSYSFHKSSYNHCSLAAPQPHLLFVRLLLGLLNWHVRPVKTAPRKQHIPDESFNWGFTYQSDEK